MKLLSHSLCILILLAPSGLYARDDMSGVWLEEYTETIVSVEEWGKHCGAAPRSPGRKKRKILYNVEDRGMDLVFTAPSGKSFTTSSCQSPNRQLKAKERNLKDKVHLVNCATPETSKSYESGLYSFRVKSANRIEYRETSRFARNVKGAICSHTSRVRRLYTRKKDAKLPVVGKKVDTPREDPCENPGQAVRLTLAPERSVLSPGQKVCLKAEAFDKNGCKADASLTWGKGDTPPGIKLNIQGCLTVTRKAKSGTHSVRLAAGKTEAGITLVVVRKIASAPPPREPEDVPEGTPEVTPPAEEPPRPPEEPPPPPIEKPEKPSPPAQPKEEELAAWILPTAIGGGVFLILVVILVIFLARKRKKIPTAPPAQPTVPEPIRPASEPGVSGVSQPSSQFEGEPVEKVFCTHCGNEVPEGAKFCPFDRTLIQRPGSPTIPSQPVCPTCLRVLPAGAKFCPYDRTKIP